MCVVLIVGCYLCWCLLVLFVLAKMEVCLLLARFVIDVFTSVVAIVFGLTSYLVLLSIVCCLFSLLCWRLSFDG